MTHMQKYNPYYSPEKLGMDLISFDEPGMSYEYNTFLFVRTPDGRIFSASDAGCSCPTPFEANEAATWEDCILTMSQIENEVDAECQLRTWGKNWNGKSFLDDSDFRNLKNWFTK